MHKHAKKFVSENISDFNPLLSQKPIDVITSLPADKFFSFVHYVKQKEGEYGNVDEEENAEYRGYLILSNDQLNKIKQLIQWD